MDACFLLKHGYFFVWQIHLSTHTTQPQQTSSRYFYGLEEMNHLGQQLNQQNILAAWDNSVSTLLPW